ncbi:NAD(+) synthase [Arenibaculum pallidiluteum]|uniref:NAD(+) synthase n=1 Tax=Arenibaculum pallidiluteum TaxID=2812559 RepID=UPI001A97554A|nr:NAD(+) synthase [Arenibaculum pallidiluteum]
MTTLRDSILDLSRQARTGALSPWFARQLDSQIDRGLFLPEDGLAEAGAKLLRSLKRYRTEAGVATAVLGMSGGVDSALTAALLKRAGWRVIGFTLPIDQVPEETERGVEACAALGIEHQHIDLSRQYHALVGELASLDPRIAEGDDEPLRTRRGNMRARLRMITLYDQAHRFGGLVASTDNFSELGAGFWTLHGDVGDLAPVQSLLKSWEVPWMARAYGVPERTWRATPTDGLGIGGGDEAQIGSTYLEWDLMVFALMETVLGDPSARAEGLSGRLGIEGDARAEAVLGTVLRRLGRTWFKRVNPIRLGHPAADRFGPLDALDARLFRPAVLREEEQVFGFPADAETMAKRLVAALRASGDRIVTAESCTSGLIGSCVASVPDSSEAFAGSFVTYRTEMKTDVLGVPEALLRERTPYDPEVARQMALGALREAPHATMALAVTGVGGPGADCGKPAGLVYVAVVRRDAEPRVEEHRFPGSPKEVLAATIRRALAMGLAMAAGVPPGPAPAQ